MDGNQLEEGILRRNNWAAATGHARSVSRRGSLRLFGAAALVAAVSTPVRITRAGKAGNKAASRCKRQKGACEAAVRANCAGNETCFSALLPCCAFLARCNAGAATRCLLAG